MILFFDYNIVCFLFCIFSQFGFFDDNGTVVELINRDFYKNDLIGLKTLNQKKRLKFVTVPGVDHFMWHINVTICDNYILPYLD